MAQPHVNQVYPNTYTTPPPFSTASNSNSNGSFRSVFVVLAIVAVISAVACVLGRICNGRNKKHEKGTKDQVKKGKDERRKVIPIGPKEWESRQKPSFRDGEIEFGLDNKRMPPSSNKNKVVVHGVPPRGPPKPYLQHGQGFKGQVRFADNV